MESTNPNRKFMIFNVTELNQIDFSQVEETSNDTIRRSINGTKTFVKWDSEGIPSSVSSLTTKQGPYTLEDMLDILKTSEWTNPNPTNLTYNG
jgi:hypothetical protein